MCARFAVAAAYRRLRPHPAPGRRVSGGVETHRRRRTRRPRCRPGRRPEHARRHRRHARRPASCSCRVSGWSRRWPSSPWRAAMLGLLAAMRGAGRVAWARAAVRSRSRWRPSPLPSSRRPTGSRACYVGARGGDDDLLRRKDRAEPSRCSNRQRDRSGFAACTSRASPIPAIPCPRCATCACRPAAADHSHGEPRVRAGHRPRDRHHRRRAPPVPRARAARRRRTPARGSGRLPRISAATSARPPIRGWTSACATAGASC